MAYDRQFLRLSFIFAILGTREVAETTCHLTGTSTAFDAVAAQADWTTSDLDDLATDYVALADGVGIFWAAYSSLVSVKLVAVDTAGHDLIAPLEAPQVGDSGVNGEIDPTDSVVISLRSAFVTGHANFGRMFLPHTKLPLGVSYRAAPATTADAGVAAVGFIRQINVKGASKVLHPSGVYNMSRLGAGETKPVFKVEISDINDTQQRRKNRLVPTRNVQVV